MHQNRIRIYTEDVDCQGIVYHANYLLYLERSRTEMLREAGVELSGLQNENRLLVIKKLEIEYIVPVKLDDLILINTQIKEIKTCSFILEQSIYEQQKMMCKAEVRVVCVDNLLKPKQLPKKIIQLVGSIVER